LKDIEGIAFIRYLRVRTLGATKKNVSDYIEELVNWDVATREEAAKNLGDIGDDTVIDPLLTALKEDESEDVRAAAARSLGKLADGNEIPKEFGKIIFKEDAPIVRRAIALALGDIGNTTTIKLMIPLLENEESHWVREAVIEAFGKNGSENFGEIIFEHLKTDLSEEVRVQSAIALIKCKSSIDLDSILSCYQEEKSDEVKSHITELIAKKPDEKSVEFLTNALENEEFKLTQAAAAEALHTIAIKLGYKDENEMLDSL